MPYARLAARNVFIYDATQQPPLLVAGCRQFGRMTNAELYFCMGICFQQPPPGQFRLSDGPNILPNDNNILTAGNYFIISPGTVLLPAAMLTKAVDPPTSIPVVLSNDELRPRTISRGSPASQVVWPCPNITPLMHRQLVSPPEFAPGTKYARSRGTICLHIITWANRHVILSPVLTPNM